MLPHKSNTFFMQDCASTALRWRGGTSKRNGLSIIEVLTALIVAIIGVFGVMSLIPFAVSQTQRGLDLDNANLYGRNAQEQFEAFDYEEPFEETAFFPPGSKIRGQMPWLIPTLPDYQNDAMSTFLGPDRPVLEPVLTDFSFYPNRRTFTAPSFNPMVPGALPAADAAYYGPQVYHIDPVGVSEGVGTFPFNFWNLRISDPALQPNPFPIPIRSATLADKSTLPDQKSTLPDQSGAFSVPLQLSPAEVTRLCTDSDRLSFVDASSRQTDETGEIGETEPMLQEFVATTDLDGDGVLDPVKRFSASSISWSVLASPLKDPLTVRTRPDLGTGSVPSKITGFRMSYLLHKDRSLIQGDEFGRMVYAPVKRLSFALGRPGVPPVTGDSQPDQNDNFLNRGYVESVNRIVMDPLNFNGDDEAEERAELFEDTFRKGDWVMLINQKPEVEYHSQGSALEGELFLGGPFVRGSNFDPAATELLSADETGFNTQIGFFRIISSQNGFNRATSLYEFNATLTVSGGGFDFFYSDIPGTDTYVVHLKNVVNVFEKTFNLQ